MSSNSYPCLSSDLVDPVTSSPRRFQPRSEPASRCEISPSRKKRNKESIRIRTLRRALALLSSLLEKDGVFVPLGKKIPMGHWRFVKVTGQALRTGIGHEVAAVVARCTERRYGKKKYPKSFFDEMEVRKGVHLKPISEWLTPLHEKDFGEGGLPLSYRSKWFKREIRMRKDGSRITEFRIYFPKIPRWMIGFGHERHYHTEEWIPNGAAETEIDHVNKLLNQSGAFDLLHGRFFCDRERDMSLVKKKALLRLHEKEAVEELCVSVTGGSHSVAGESNGCR